MDSLDLQRLSMELDSLVLFRGIRTDHTFADLRELLGRLAARALPRALLQAYASLAARLARAVEAGQLPPGDPLTGHLLSLFLFDDNALARMLASRGLSACDAALIGTAEREWRTFRALWGLGMAGLQGLLAAAGLASFVDTDWTEYGSGLRLRPPAAEDEVRQLLVRSESWSEVLRGLEAYWKRCGTGVFARYRAFRWVHEPSGGRIEPISHPDPIRLDDLIGNERERKLLVANTRHFLLGLPANNVLLYGDAGTGKSSMVKALVNEFGDQGLRLIEVAKEHLADFPHISAHLRGRPERFIVFVDDLSFEEQETQYKVLKAALEGTVEARPANVVVYATSNRRHLVREFFGDRSGEGEVHARDTQQEKLSLADRFGLHLTFVSPGQEEYLRIVMGLAERRRLPVGSEELRRRALQWAQWQRGWSGRTARQFVDYLTAELAFRDQLAGRAPEKGASS